MAHDQYLRQLIARAQGGTIPPQEVQQIAQAVTKYRAGRDLYQRLYAVARAGGPAYEPLIATYLIYPEDPEVSGLAVQVLTGHWRVGAKYSKQILELLGSPEWDLSDDAFIAAVSGAGETLHDEFDWAPATWAPPPPRVPGRRLRIDLPLTLQPRGQLHDLRLDFLHPDTCRRLPRLQLPDQRNHRRPPPPSR
ncbi:hypothetical protein [Streptomyces sp. NPDC050388]|uniref:hypothetical protein n=1 Tax=Streptomyces sp. NPDC050388 TaxID=3155781 RepID=UPI003428DCB5